MSRKSLLSVLFLLIVLLFGIGLIVSASRGYGMLPYLYSFGSYERSSQSSGDDSITFVNSQWQGRTEDGISFKWHTFTDDNQLFGAPQIVFLIDVPAREISRISLAYDTAYATVDDQAQRVGALAAVNGTFFKFYQGNTQCYLRVDGKEIYGNAPHRNDSTKRKYFQDAVVVLDSGVVRVVQPSQEVNYESSLQGDNIVTSGPLLVYDGKEQPLHTELSFTTRRYARTAMGLRPDSSVVLLEIDGHHKQCGGVSLMDLAKMMRWLGCHIALNLDGGGSSTYYLRPNAKEQAEKVGGIRSYPADNLLFDHDGARRVTNIIYIKPSKY